MGKKPTIIILHGWGLSGARFEPLKKELTDSGYTVYAPDLPGFGNSGFPARALYLSDYADFLQAYIKKHSIRNPILIGHSFGGRVSLKFNFMFPGEVHALILTGTPGFTPVPKKRLILFITLAKIGKGIFSVWPLSVAQERIRNWYYYLVGARDFYRASGIMREIFKHIVQEDLNTALVAVRVPCLLVWGADDGITPVWIAEKMHSVISGSVLHILPDSDHGVSYKQPKRFVPFVTEFTESL